MPSHAIHISIVFTIPVFHEQQVLDIHCTLIGICWLGGISTEANGGTRRHGASGIGTDGDNGGCLGQDCYTGGYTQSVDVVAQVYAAGAGKGQRTTASTGTGTGAECRGLVGSTQVLVQQDSSSTQREHF